MRRAWDRCSWGGRILGILAVAMLATAPIVAARRDLAGRPPDRLRGDPRVWRRITFLPGAATVYLLVGRRRDQ